MQICRFNAITKENDKVLTDTAACEGCGLCVEICPAKAIDLIDMVSGELKQYKNDKMFSTAQLKMGNGNSGKLVSEVKKKMLQTDIITELAIIDGSPGIGCPVISSLSGVDLVLIVTEPTISGFSDLKRIIRTAKIFQTQMAVCINKYDINTENSSLIESFCEEKKIPMVGMIAFDIEFVKALNEGKNIIDSKGDSVFQVKEVFNNTIKLLNIPNKGERNE